MSGYPMGDLEARMVPSAANLTEAREAIATSGKEMAIVPIAFPGKTFGIWTFGTEVENPDGAWACNNDITYREATLEATAAAAIALGERPGTVGWVVVRADETWAVFEDILSPVDVLRYARKAGKI